MFEIEGKTTKYRRRIKERVQDKNEKVKIYTYPKRKEINAIG